ncbi:MAG: class I SAM-dependent methyltransferase [Balneolaceae bacterium]
MNWFEEWFDSPLYEKLYAYRNEDEAVLLAHLIEQEIPKDAYSDILDLGCGRGRHSLTLAERGYNVTGLDLSEMAIRKAKEKAADRDLDNVRFLVRDMRNPLSERFDAVLNLFTSFGYFIDDNENALVFDSVEKMLQKRGRLLIDFMNSEKVRATLVPEETGSYREIQYSIKRWIENNMVFKEINFHLNGESKSYTERVKLYNEEWFKNELNKRNFNIYRCYGSYEGKPFDPENSSRLILLAEKQ